MQRKKTLLIGVAILTLAIVCLAKTRKLGGKMVAYDFMKHSAKSASLIQNEEVVVLETPNEKQKYVKLMFSSPGTSQIDAKYFDGTQPLEADVFRDHACDEKVPTFVSQVSMEQIAGTYLLTEPYKSHPPSRIKNLECYVVIYKKKK